MGIEIQIGASFDAKDVQRAQRELQKLGRIAQEMGETTAQRLARTGQAMQSLGKDMTMKVTAPLVAVGAASVKLAADLEDSMGATEQIFGSAAGSVQQWAKDLPSYFGIAESAALSHVNIMGSMLQNIGGLAEDEAAKQGQALLELAGDLTAMYGGTVEDAVRALTGALKGNNSMLDNYGMGVNEATIKAKALEMGIHSGTGALSLQAKQAATLALIWEQTGDAQGQAAREANSASGRMRALKTDVLNLATDIGTQLLPFVSKAAEIFSSLAGFLSNLPGPVKSVIVAIGGLVAAFGPLVWVAGAVMEKISALLMFDWSGMFSKGTSAVKGFATAVQGGMGRALAAVRAMSVGSMVAMGAIGLAIAAAGVALNYFVNEQAENARRRFKTLNVSVDSLRESFQMLVSRNVLVGALEDLPTILQDIQTEAEGAYNEFAKINFFGEAGQGDAISWLTSVDDNAARARESLALWDAELSAMDVNQAVAQFQALSRQAEALGYSLPLDMFPQLKQAIELAAMEANMSVDDFMAMAGAGGQVKTEFQQATEALQDYEDEIRSQFDPLFGYGDAMDKAADAVRRQEEAAWNVLAATEEFGAGSYEAEKAQRDYEKSVRDTTQATLGAGFELERLKEGLRSGAVRFTDASAALDGLVASGLMTQQQADATKQEWRRLADQVLVTPSWKDIYINSNADTLLDQLRQITSLLGGITDSVINRVAGAAKILANRNRAAGGPVEGGKIGWVGERGPELFIPNVDGTIVPHYQSRRIMDELGGGQQAQPQVVPARGGDVYVTVNKSDASPYEIGRELLWTMKVAG